MHDDDGGAQASFVFMVLCVVYRPQNVTATGTKNPQIVTLSGVLRSSLQNMAAEWGWAVRSFCSLVWVLLHR